MPIVLIFSSMVFSLEKTLNQRKAHKSVPHFWCAYACVQKNVKKKNTFSFSLTYMEALDTFVEQGNL